MINLLGLYRINSHILTFSNINSTMGIIGYVKVRYKLCTSIAQVVIRNRLPIINTKEHCTFWQIVATFLSFRSVSCRVTCPRSTCGIVNYFILEIYEQREYSIKIYNFCYKILLYKLVHLICHVSLPGNQHKNKFLPPPPTPVRPLLMFSVHTPIPGPVFSRK